MRMRIESEAHNACGKSIPSTGGEERYRLSDEKSKGI